MYLLSIFRRHGRGDERCRRDCQEIKDEERQRKDACIDAKCSLREGGSRLTDRTE